MSGLVYFSISESHALNRYGQYHDTGQGRYLAYVYGKMS